MKRYRHAEFADAPVWMVERCTCHLSPVRNVLPVENHLVPTACVLEESGPPGRFVRHKCHGLVELEAISNQVPQLVRLVVLRKG